MKCSIVAPANSRSFGKLNVRRTATRLAPAGLVVLLCLVASRVGAQTYTTLANFNGTDGENPWADLTLSGSTLYGTTNVGGANNDGAVFSVPVTGGSLTTLLSLNGSNGQTFFSGVTVVGQTLYGAAWGGGAYGDGDLFSLPVSGGSPTILFSFNSSDGQNPRATMTLSGSTLYGTTQAGGANFDGTVFSFSTVTKTFTSLGSLNNATGSQPQGALTLVGSTLFGTTTQGGVNGEGTIFSLPVTGGTPKTVFTFSGSNGEYLYGGLALSGSTLYGITTLGGAYNYGTVFSIPVSGGTPTTLVSFNTIGAEPGGTLVVHGSTLYGESGGSIFSLSTHGGSPTILTGWYDGYSPEGSMTFSGSSLYGTTAYGGTYGDGTVFSLTLPLASIGLAKAANVTIITGGSADLGTTVMNSAPAGNNNLNYTLSAVVQSGTATLGTITSSTGSLAPSARQSCTVSAASTHLGVNTIALTASDPSSSNLSQTTTATLTVLDHAAAAFADGSTTLTLTFGNVQQSSGTQSLQFQIENLPAAYRAGLALNSLTTISDPLGVFSTDATTFTDLASGAESGTFDLFLNTSKPGEFSGEYRFNLSDEQDISGWAGQQTLTLDVTANVVPEPSALALAATGALGLLGCGWRRRRRPGAQPSLDDPSLNETVCFKK